VIFLCCSSSFNICHLSGNGVLVCHVIESDSPLAGGSHSYYCFSRWGRVGVRGQQNLAGPFSSADAAVNEFTTKFYSKTKNLWSQREHFSARPKCHTWIEMDYEEEKPKVRIQALSQHVVLVDSSFWVSNAQGERGIVWYHEILFMCRTRMESKENQSLRNQLK
jgi:predicted DNA-binding WGR domain protein